MKTKPDVHAATRHFLLGAGTPNGGQATGEGAPAEGLRITKTIRIDRAVDLAIKHAALARTSAGGARVTESDLIEQAVRQYLNV